MSQPQNSQNPPPQSSQQPPHDPQYRIPQYQYPQQPGSFGQKPEKQKKPLLKRWWFWVIAIIVVIIIASALGGGSDETSSESAGTSSSKGQKAGAAEEKKADAPDEEDSHSIGDTVAADDWEITVNSVEDGVAKVGDEYLGAEAQGQFVQIALSVKNTGSAPDYFFEDDIKLADDDGNTYSADSEAGIYAAEDNILFLEEINPGNTAKGVLVFDVPEDVDPSRLTFAGGLFSDPVEISLK
jgi:hypothetical protein